MGAALIKVLDANDNKYSTNIRAVDDPNEAPAPRQHRRARTAFNDWKHEHLDWNHEWVQNGRGLHIRPRIKNEFEIEMGWEDDEVMRDIRNLVEQKGERVPDKKEARAMAALCRSARRIIVGEFFLL
jgi:hypothetical protein